MILQKVKRLVDNTQLVKFIFMSQKHKRFGHISYKVWKEERQNGEKTQHKCCNNRVPRSRQASHIMKYMGS